MLQLKNPTRDGTAHIVMQPQAFMQRLAARLPKRVFQIDVERCARGGQLKIVAAIEAPMVIVRILTHLGLAVRALSRAAAREFSLHDAA